MHRNRKTQTNIYMNICVGFGKLCECVWVLLGNHRGAREYHVPSHVESECFEETLETFHVYRVGQKGEQEIRGVSVVSARYSVHDVH